MGLRITTWNVNGIRNPFSYEPWRGTRTFESMFEILESDIVVIQEAKIQRKDLRDDMVLVPGWDCYFSLPRFKKGYSGVVIYTRNSTCSPIRAEEGITGVLCPPGSSTAFRDMPEDCQIGGYPTLDQFARAVTADQEISDERTDAATLDSEGRCVVLEFPAFVLIGTYCPAHRDESRDSFRMDFLHALDARVRNLVSQGKRVFVTGDINISKAPIDSAHALEDIRKGSTTKEEFLSSPPRRLFNALLADGTVTGGRAMIEKPPVLHDICRAFHPDRPGMYTCWDTRLNTRPGNYGSRIDYVLCSLDMRGWFADSNIQEGLMGSDHCPVYAQFEEKVFDGGAMTHILDIVNPPGTFKNGKRQREYSSQDVLPTSGRLLAEFDVRKRQNIKDMFTRKKSTSRSITQSTSDSANEAAAMKSSQLAIGGAPCTPVEDSISGTRSSKRSLPPFRCNRKLIGARFFSNGYESQFGKLNASLYTARDDLGHGTPTLSIAGGNFVRGANVLGFGNGTAKGGSPRARVAAYKVCWLSTTGIQCTDADVMDAFEAAISDGVDVISFSLGKPIPPEFFEDGFSIGAFHAIVNGVMVVAGAGNEGPGFGTVTNVAPWMFTVAASTIDRKFANYLALGDKKHIMGASLSTGLPSEKFYPLINSVDAKAANATVENAQLCNAGSLDPKKAKGKILICLVSNLTGTILAGQGALLAGAVGVVLVNNEKLGNDIVAVVNLLPASHINFTDGEYVYSYTKLTKAPKAYMTRARTQVGIKPAPVMASFSSRGPSIIQPAILKPDITAPGVDILFAFPEGIGPTGLDSDKRRIPFNIAPGTSASCPHVTGIAGLLKTAYPHWSPAAIRSAIMTTAMTLDNNNRPILEQSEQEATPFAYGAGHIQPDLAMDPGLVYDLNPDDYLNFLCAHGYNQTQIMLFSKSPYTCPKSFSIADFNYPSITVPNLGNHFVTITRTLTNVGYPGTYSVHVKAPHGVSVLVEPSFLTFEKAGEKKTFKVILKWIGVDNISDYVSGEMWWSDGKHKVKSPIVVKHN